MELPLLPVSETSLDAELLSSDVALSVFVSLSVLSPISDKSLSETDCLLEQPVVSITTVSKSAADFLKNVFILRSFTANKTIFQYVYCFYYNIL